MKNFSNIHIDVLPDDIQNPHTGRDNQGVRIDIEGEVCIYSRDDYHKISIWLTKKEVKQLIKEIREEMR